MNKIEPVGEIGVRDITGNFFSNLKPKEKLYIEDWSDKYRILASQGSSIKGPWRTSRNPLLKEIMHELSDDSPHRQVVWVAPTQFGKSEVLINFLLSGMHQDPGPELLVQPTISDCRKFVRQRLDPAIDKMPVIRNLIGNVGKKKGGDSDLIKMFIDGILMLGWSNSLSSLSSMPIKKLGIDEVEKFVEDVEGQGCPVDQAIQRTGNFPDAKIFITSSPGNEHNSRIWPLYLRGDQRRYYTPCWHCGELFYMDLPQVEWETQNGIIVPGSVRVKCPKCEYLNEENKKNKMLAAGEWVPENTNGEYPSFNNNALHKPLGLGETWHQYATSFRVAKKKQSAYKVWHCTKRAQPWKQKKMLANWEKLHARRSVYKHQVPDPVLIITAGVDVQDDRLEAEAVGWGRSYENWGIENVIFYGDTSKNIVWDDLDAWLKQPFDRSDSKQFIAATCVDALGHRTDKVYRWCKPRELRRIFPAYGRGGDGLPILGKVVRRHKSGVFLFPIGTDTCKDEIVSNLLVEEIGPNYSHFPALSEYDEEYFKQLTAERKVSEIKNNKEIWKWEKIRERNEALDKRQLNRAALEITSVDLDKMTSPYLAQPVVTTPRKKRRKKTGIKL